MLTRPRTSILLVVPLLLAPAAAAQCLTITSQPRGGLFAPGTRFLVDVIAHGSSPIRYQWRHNGEPLSNGGSVHGADTDLLIIDPALEADEGQYDVYLSNDCTSILSSPATVIALTGPCYPNCDGSTIYPILNVNDVICFETHFAIGDSYANRDNSTTPPVLNVNDFVCFLNRFAAGCS